MTLLNKILPKSITCPHCGYVANCASNIEDEDLRPTEGDPNICIRCVELSVYGDDLQLRLPTYNDIEGYSPETVQEIAFLQNTLLSAKVQG
jgi:hypothetical protein